MSDGHGVIKDDMPSSVVSLNRRFQVWSYQLSHGELLLRSCKDELHQTRVDLFFKNVLAVNMPTLADLDTVETAEAPAEHLSPSLGAWMDVNATQALAGQRLYLLRGRNCTGYVVASHFAHAEDDREYFEPSPFASTTPAA